jgi:hypothetical protein
MEQCLYGTHVPAKNGGKQRCVAFDIRGFHTRPRLQQDVDDRRQAFQRREVKRRGSQVAAPLFPVVDVRSSLQQHGDDVCPAVHGRDGQRGQAGVVVRVVAGASLEQAPYHARGAVARGDVQWRVTIVVRPVRVRTSFKQDSDVLILLGFRV